MAGVTAVILVSAAVPAQELNVVSSAAQAGVGHVVKAGNKASADSPIARRRGQAEPEAGLAAPGLAHTLLRSSATCRNLLALAPAIARTSGFGSSAGKGRAGMVEARDAGTVAAEIAASPASHAGKTFWLTGLELISNYDVAAVLSGLLGRAVTYTELSFDENRDAMIRAGVSAPVAEMNARAFSLTAGGDAEDGHRRRAGHPRPAGPPLRAVRRRPRGRVLLRGDPRPGGRMRARPAPERAEARTPVCGCRRASPPLPRLCRPSRRSCAVAAARAGCA
jgi:uncharacterized protein YbjT (DUF2867 family)